MKAKKLLFMTTTLLSVSVLAGCNRSNKTQVDFWTGFGSGVNGTLLPLIELFEAANPDVKVNYETKGGYPNLQEAITNSISTSKYPHIANGYPDHFAVYAGSNVLLNLNTDTYIKGEDGVKVDEYYQDYMKENKELVDNQILGLPFNKSTELMVTNQSFFDLAAQFDEGIVVPTTWQELEVVGEKIINLVNNKGWIKKLVLNDGTTIDKPASTDAPLADDIKAKVVLDMSFVDKLESFRPFSWDSTSNFFITILRQWGAVYTERGANLNTGYIRFHEGENRDKTLEALTLFKRLFTKGIVGTPASYGESQFSSKPFKEGKLVLTISSSAGVKENLPTQITEFPFTASVNPIPYNGDKPDQKYVISQGTNLGLFKRGKAGDDKTKAERAAAWKLLKFLTYEVNYAFSKGTSYFPVYDGSKLVEAEEPARFTDYKMYQEFLVETGGTPGEVITRDTAALQQNVYMNSAEDGPNWKKFVDPGFIGSSRIRNEVEYVMPTLFDTKLNYAPERVLEEIVNTLRAFVEK